jgi:xylulokinase
VAARNPLVLGLDVGTSAIKVGAFAVAGTLAAQTEKKHPLAINGPLAEQDPATTWRLLVDAAREVVREANGEVVAIAVSNQRGSVVALDPQGHALGPYLVWMDRRGLPWVDWLEERLGAAAFYRECGTPIVPYTGISKLVWYQREAVPTFEAAATLASPQTLLLRQLGCDEDVCDASTGTFLFPFDIQRQTWSETIASRIDFPLNKLPRLVSAVDIVGRLAHHPAEELGLPVGTPLVAGGGDGQCAGVGSGAIVPGRAMVNVGTGAGIQTFLPDPLLDPAQTLNCAAHVVPRAWELEGHTQASGAALRWLRDAIEGEGGSYERLIDRIEATPPGAEGLLFIPTFNGSSAPRVDPNARACLLGLTLTHGLDHVVRAVLEGISLELRWMLDAMIDTGVAVDDVRLVGGGARDPRWNQIHADVLARPLSTLAVPDAALVGAGMCAAVAIGAYADLHEAERAFVHIAATIDPSTRFEKIYIELSERYRATFELLSRNASFSAVATADAVAPEVVR